MSKLMKFAESFYHPSSSTAFPNFWSSFKIVYVESCGILTFICNNININHAFPPPSLTLHRLKVSGHWQSFPPLKYFIRKTKKQKGGWVSLIKLCFKDSINCCNLQSGFFTDIWAIWSQRPVYFLLSKSYIYLKFNSPHKGLHVSLGNWSPS